MEIKERLTLAQEEFLEARKNHEELMKKIEIIIEESRNKVIAKQAIVNYLKGLRTEDIQEEE